MNSAERAMAEWLAHPMEFGQPPAEVVEIHRQKTPWPLFEQEESMCGQRRLDG